MSCNGTTTNLPLNSDSQSVSEATTVSASSGSLSEQPTAPVEMRDGNWVIVLIAVAGFGILLVCRSLV